MSDHKEETQKTVVSFVVGLLVGGLLVWSFSPTKSISPTVVNDEAKEVATTTATVTPKKEVTIPEKAVTAPKLVTLPIGEGAVKVADQTAGLKVVLESATFPIKEGWIGVRDYNDDKLGGLLGVARFSEAQGLVPTSIILQRATAVGKNYALVFYTENGDREFSLATDTQVDKIFATFTVK